MRQLIRFSSLLLILCLVFLVATESLAQVKASKTSIAFGAVTFNTTKKDSFYVTNDSTTTFDISSAAAATARFTVTKKTGSLPVTVTKGDTVWFYVEFLPNATATFVDTVALAHTGTVTASPVKITLSGSSPNLIKFIAGNSTTVLTSLTMANSFANQLGKDSLRIYNGTAGLINVTLQPFSNPEFRWMSPTAFTVAVSETSKVYVGYVGALVGRDIDTIRITHDSPIGGSSPVNLAIRARALGSFAWAATSVGAPLDTHVMRVNAANTGTTPGSVYPALAVDSTRALTIYLRNIGPAGGAIFRVDSLKFKTPHFYSVQPVPFSIKPDNSAVYEILVQTRFQPLGLSAPTYLDTLYMWTNDTIPGGKVVKLPVEGASRNANYLMTDRSRQDIYFGNVNVGTVSSDSAIRVYNYRTIGMTVDSVKLVGGNSKFLIRAGFKQNLGMGDTSLIKIAFAPLDTLPNSIIQRDTVLVYHTGSSLANNPWKIPVYGRPVATVQFVPSGNIALGDVNTGTNRDTILTAYNRTATSVKIDSLRLFKGTNFTLLSNDQNITIPATDSTKIQLRFNGATVGPYVDTLYIWNQFPAALGFTNPRKVVLTASVPLGATILAANYVPTTVDNVEGIEGVGISSADSSYREVGQFWTNLTNSFGPGHRRTPNLSGSANGNYATYTFTVANSAPYLVYSYLLNSPNVGGNHYMWFYKFGIGGVFDSIRYNGFENRTLVPGYAGTWRPLMMHYVDGFGKGAASVRVGADERSGGFLRLDAFRLLRSQQKYDIEFGRRDINFSANRVPEEFPEVTLGDVLERDYRLYNLGSDTLVITNIQFFSTNTLPTPRFSVKNVTYPVRVPPMTTDLNGVEKGGYFDMRLTFAPFQEEVVRDSMVITSNDVTEPKAYIVLNGTGINYNFIMNASAGGVEPHFRAPQPGPGSPITTVPRYYEGPYGSWSNSTLAGVTYPIPGGNFSSRVNVGSTPTLTTPHEAFYEFELPDVVFGQIPTDGQYIFEYGGPAGSPNGYSRTEVTVAQTFGVQSDTGYFSGVTDGTHQWLQIGGGLKTFNLNPGGKISVKYARNTKTDAASGTGVLRLDLLRIRKVPSGALIGLSVANPDSLSFGNVNFRTPGGFDGKANQRNLTIGSRGEKQLIVKNVRLRDGTRFSILNKPAANLPLRAINGQYVLTLAFAPNKIQTLYRDTLEVYSNSSRATDTLLIVPLSGTGVGGIFFIDDDNTASQIYSTPSVSGLYLNTWDKSKINNWQREVSTVTPNPNGYGTTRLMLPIPFNPNGLSVKRYFEWYPEIPAEVGSPDSVYVNVVATVGAGATKVSPAARYKVYSQNGIITRDTLMNQNGLTAGTYGVAEINLGNHWFLRGGKDASTTSVFGHVRVENDTNAVGLYYKGLGQINVAVRDTFALVADAVIIRELANPSPTVGVENTENLPTVYALDQNYPNPFNPATTIRFALPERSDVSLKIYDLLGREVRTMVNGVMVPGFHSIVWNGRDNSGHGVSTGVYFYRLSAGSFVEVKKMIMLK